MVAVAEELPKAGRLVSDEGRLPNPVNKPVPDDEEAGA